MMMYKEDANKPPSESRSHQFHFESNSFYNAEDRSIELGPFLLHILNLNHSLKKSLQSLWVKIMVNKYN